MATLFGHEPVVVDILLYKDACAAMACFLISTKSKRFWWLGDLTQELLGSVDLDPRLADRTGMSRIEETGSPPPEISWLPLSL